MPSCYEIYRNLKSIHLSGWLGIKVVGVSIVAERETSQQTGDLCLKVVAGLGVEDVTFSDIDTAHRGAIPRGFQQTKRHYLKIRA